MLYLLHSCCFWCWKENSAEPPWLEWGSSFLGSTIFTIEPWFWWHLSMQLSLWGNVIVKKYFMQFCLGLFSIFPKWFSQNNRSYSSLLKEPIVFDVWYVQGEPFRSFFTWMVEFSLKTFQQFSCENQLLSLHSLWIWTWGNVLLCHTDFFFPSSALWSTWFLISQK